jgi:hypothetical protein
LLCPHWVQNAIGCAFPSWTSLTGPS